MTIPYQTTIPANAVDKDTLISLVASLASAMNQVADVQVMYVISTLNVDFSSMLDTLAEGLRAGAKANPSTGSGRREKPAPWSKKEAKGKKKAARVDPMSRASYRFLSNDTVITTRELNKELANRDPRIQPNDRLQNHKGEDFVVIDDDGEYRLVKEPQ